MYSHSVKELKKKGIPKIGIIFFFKGSVTKYRRRRLVKIFTKSLKVLIKTNL